MCQSCKPIRAYQMIESNHELNQMKEDAYALVEQGTFSILREFNEPSQDFREVQFLCEDCGKIHVLWLHTFMCRTGGEWRSVTCV